MPPNFWPSTLVDLAQIVAAVATFAAVVVSLWLAHRKPVPDLRGSVTIKLLLRPGVNDPKVAPRAVAINVVNVGPIPAVITSQGWLIRHWRKSKRVYGYQVPASSAAFPYPRLPKRIEHGEEVTFWLPAGEAGGWLTAIEENGFFPETLTTRRDLERLRATIATSVGTDLQVELPVSAQDLIWTAQEKYFARARGE